jgi:hypothetical protein
MHDPILVRGLEGFCDLGRHRHRSTGRESLPQQNALFKGPTRKVLHGDVVRSLVRFAPVEDAHDVRVGEASRALRLPSKPFDELLIVGVATAQDLQGDVPIHDFVVGQIYLGHTSAAQWFEDTVAAIYDLLHGTDCTFLPVIRLHAPLRPSQLSVLRPRSLTC